MRIINRKKLHIPTSRYLAATIIPVALFYFSILLLINNINRQYEFTQKEIKGVSLIGQLHNSIIELQKIRGLSLITLNNSGDLFKEVRRLQHEFNETFKNLTAGESSEKIIFSTELEAVKEKINPLFGSDLMHMNKNRLFIEYTDSIAELKQIIKIAADRSNLTLDPELDSYYMMSLIAVQFPEIIELLGRVRGKGSDIIAGKQITEEEKDQLLAHIAVLRVGLENMKNTTRIIYSVSPELKKHLYNIMNVADRKAKLFIEETIEAIEGTGNLSPTDYFRKGTDTITAYLAPYEIIGKMLTKRLLERADKLRDLRNFSISGTILAALLIIYFAFSFYKYNKDMFEKIQHMSLTDMLTGLYNRRYFHMVIKQEMNRVHRERKSFSLAIVDIDFFKPYNDYYGHLEGDKVIIEVANSLKENLKRAGDFVFRIGGEEFCFFIAGESREATLAIAEEIRKAVEKLAIRHGYSTVSPVLTISIGIVYLNEMGIETYSDLMKAADNALYKAKNNGRNRCEITHFKSPLQTTLSHV